MAIVLLASHSWAQTKQVFVAPAGNNINLNSDGSGSSWENAYSDLFSALKTDMNGFTELRIYIKEGDYYNHSAGDATNGEIGGERSTLPNGVNVFVEGSHFALATGTDITTYNYARNATNFINPTALFQMNVPDGELSVKGINVLEPEARSLIVGGFFTIGTKNDGKASFEDIKITVTQPVNDDPGVGFFHADDAERLTLSLKNVTVTGAMETGVITLWSDSSGANITIKDSYFANNQITIARGGVVNMVSENNTLIVDNTVFYNNKTQTRDGGAIFLSTGSTATITNSIFKENHTSGASASGTGGAIHAESGSTLNSTNNKYVCNWVGDASYGGGAIFSAGTLNSTNDVFVGNYNLFGAVAGQGGAILASGVTTITNGQFYWNRINSYGGAIHSSNDLTVKNSKFQNNQANNNHGVGNGGAISSNDGILQILGDSVANSWFRNNQSPGAGGAVWRSDTDKFFKVDHTGFYENISGYSTAKNNNGGGAIFLSGNRNGAEIDNSDFFNNSTWVNDTTNGGGAIKVDGLSWPVENDNITSFTYNRFKGNSRNGYIDTSNGNGGADIKLYFSKIMSGSGTHLQLLDTGGTNPSYPAAEYPNKTGMLFDGETQITLPTFPTMGDRTCAMYVIEQVSTRIIIAKDDIFDIASGNYDPISPGTTSTVSVLQNDLYSYTGATNDTDTPATLNNVNITILASQSPNVTLDPATGLVSVAQGTFGGTYWIEYQITDQQDADVFDTAFVWVEVEGPCVKPPFTGGPENPTHIGISTINRNTEDWITANNGFIQLESQQYGFVPTRMTSAQRSDIQLATEGMMIWNTDLKCLELFDGTAWKCTSQSCNQ